MNNNSPYLIDAEALNERLQDDKPLILIDLCSDEHYAEGHIPQAIHIKPSQLSCGQKPAPGKLPSTQTLQALFQSIGLTTDTEVIVYDDAGSSWAGRMIWTLDLIGHSNAKLLDGGRNSWVAAGFNLSQDVIKPITSTITISINQNLIAEKNHILATLEDTRVSIWDARSRAEYDGSKVLAKRGGHIPNAVLLEWTDLSDSQGLLLNSQTLQAMLNDKGLHQDQEIITHCQTHRRSGLSYFVAKKLLGYKNVKAYPGSWSEWGNADDTPIANETHKAGEA